MPGSTLCADLGHHLDHGRGMIQIDCTLDTSRRRSGQRDLIICPLGVTDAVKASIASIRARAAPGRSRATLINNAEGDEHPTFERPAGQ
jgi:hypothetical protein